MVGETDIKSLPPHLQLLLTDNKHSGINLKHSPFITSSKVHGIRGSSIVDSGAGVSVVSDKLIRRIQNIKSNAIVVSRYEADLRGANDSKLQVVGIVKLEFKLGGDNYEHWFLVTEKLPYDMILGNNWIVPHKAVVLAYKGLVLIPNHAGYMQA